MQLVGERKRRDQKRKDVAIDIIIVTIQYGTDDATIRIRMNRTDK